MKNSQNQNSSKVQKDDVTRKSPTLFIQLGLVLALLVSYLAIESKTFVDPTVVAGCPTDVSPEDEIIPEIPESEAIPIKKQQEVDLDKFDVVDNNRVIAEKTIIPQDPEGPVTIPKINIDSIKVGKVIDPEVYDIKFVSEAPVFPGCSGTNEELKKCFSEKVQKFVSSKFDTTLAEGLELSGKQRIAVQFIVDNNGKITDVKVRGPHKRLENEAERVVNLLPQMTPGKQQYKPVKVKYTLPIVFEIQ